MQTPEVVVMVGLRGCGKSTWVKDHLAATHLVISKELWPDGTGRARRHRAIEQALAAGLDVVVDDPNPSPVERAAIIAIARRHGVAVRAVFIDAPVADCLARARARAGRGAPAPAPAPAGAGGAGRRRLVPPRPEEGFQRVDTVVAVWSAA